jgi:tRNA threonylcarbamoyladenosine biosynthesis protein TsaE
VSRSPLHTERLGERLGHAARAGDVFALWGELGAGKTVLARGIASGLGISAAEVTSPTFIILHEHSAGRLPLFHLDLYRLSHSDLGTTGWEEAVDGGGVAVIEWPDRAGPDLPADRLDVRLEHAGESERRVVLEGTGARSRALIDGIRGDVAGG